MKRNIIIGIVLVLMILGLFFYFSPTEKKSVPEWYTIWTGETDVKNVSWSAF